ncbi:hypothetical protein B0J17DRAFT_154188 [Rhizoctonia solani]|nr:hypothetical protein B0J17DRAFT_154188 [Rhizoctonia solani]
MTRPDELKDRLLAESDFLRGIAFSASTGPYKCSQQAAQLRGDAIYSVQTSQDIAVEDIYPANELDARFAHLGWPAPSALPAQPWDILNPRTQTPSSSSTWISRRMVGHKWIISIRVEDLIAIDPFVEAVETALKNSSAGEKIRALRGVFAAWGEMIPLAAVVGFSLAATGTLGSNQNLTGNASTFRPPDRGPDIMQMIDHSLDITGTFERRFESRIQSIKLRR